MSSSYSQSSFPVESPRPEVTDMPTTTLVDDDGVSVPGNARIIGASVFVLFLLFVAVILYNRFSKRIPEDSNPLPIDNGSDDVPCLHLPISNDSISISSSDQSPYSENPKKTESSDSTTNEATMMDADAAYQKKHFLDDEETFKQAKILFPILFQKIKSYEHISLRPNMTLERFIMNDIEIRLDLLYEKNDGRYSLLMKEENAEDLCIYLGIEPTIVHNRYKAVRKLKRDLNLTTKTPTMTSIRHLVNKIRFNNPFGNTKEEYQENYKEKSWLDYYGIEINPRDPSSALTTVKSMLKSRAYDTIPMHGTSGKALIAIFRGDGKLLHSGYDGTRHDFGKGFYYIIGEFEFALSFAIDRCWPYKMFANSETGMNETVWVTPNPALILFPQVREKHKYSKKERKKLIYNVNTTIRKESSLQDQLRGNKYEEFKNKKQSWKSKSELNWKSFVTLSRFYESYPSDYFIYTGFLHDCETTEETNKCKEPKIDNDELMQYCVRFANYANVFNEEKECPLGSREKQVFIEFNVPWKYYFGIPGDVGFDNLAEETVKAGQNALREHLQI